MNFEELKLANSGIQIIDGDRGKNYPKQDEFFSSEACLFLNAKNVTSNGFEFNEKSFITREKDAVLRKGKLERNDIVLTTRGTVGNVAYYSERVPYESIRINSGMVILRADGDFCPNFLYWMFRSDYIQDQITSIRTGSAQPQLPITIMRNLQLVKPELAEQRAIAATLSALDAKIELNNRINKTLEEMAQALFKRWFVDFEFPDENGQPYKSSGGEMEESELGPVPMGWKVVDFEDVFDFQEGPGIRNWQYVTENGTKFINIRCIKNNDLQLNTASMISNEEANGKYSHFMLKEWDVVVSTSGTLGRYAIVRKEHLPLCLNTSVIRFSPKAQFECFSFMFGYLTSVEFYKHLISKACGSVQANFGPMHLHQIKLVFPAEQILHKYHSDVFPLIKKCVQIRSENQKLSTLRDALLPKLMSGEIRVPIEEVAAHV